MELNEKQKQKIKLNRKEYKNLKKADRSQMQDFVNGIYIAGFQEGSTNNNVRPEDIYTLLINTKGIGEAKAQAAMEKITQLFE